MILEGARIFGFAEFFVLLLSWLGQEADGKLDEGVTGGTLTVPGDWE